MFRALLEASLRHRVLVLALAAALLGIGLFEAVRLPVDVLPDLTRPTVAVQIEAPGFAVVDVETQVAYPLETALSGLPGISRLRSLSTAGLAIVYAEFDWDSDLYRNRQLVAERLEAARGQWPEGLVPRIGPPTSLMGEILLVALQADGSDADPQTLRSHADWTLRPALLAVPGVAQVLAIGGEIRQYEVQPDPSRMRLFGVTLDELHAALRGYGQNLGGGLIESGGQEVAVRATGKPFAFDELAQVAVTRKGAAVVRVGQVADLAVGHRFPRGSAGANGHAAVILAIQKQPGVDTLALTEALEAKLAALDGGLPKGSKRLTVFRQADFIRHSVGNVLDALRDGAVIVAIILLVFLLSGRATRDRADCDSVVGAGRAADADRTRPVDQHDDLGRAGDRGRRTGRRRGGRRRERGASAAPAGRKAADRRGADRDGWPGNAGSALRHPLRHPADRAGVRAAVRARRCRGPAVRAARHRLHRSDCRQPGGGDHGDAGAVLGAVRSRRRICRWSRAGCWP
jgi:heavy-metal exporter, HME family